MVAKLDRELLRVRSSSRTGVGSTTSCSGSRSIAIARSVTSPTCSRCARDKTRQRPPSRADVEVWLLGIANQIARRAPAAPARGQLRHPRRDAAQRSDAHRRRAFAQRSAARLPALGAQARLHDRGRQLPAARRARRVRRVPRAQARRRRGRQEPRHHRERVQGSASLARARRSATTSRRVASTSTR